jgi:hypothetical protein
MRFSERVCFNMRMIPTGLSVEVQKSPSHFGLPVSQSKCARSEPIGRSFRLLLLLALPSLFYLSGSTDQDRIKPLPRGTQGELIPALRSWVVRVSHFPLLGATLTGARPVTDRLCGRYQSSVVLPLGCIL